MELDVSKVALTRRRNGKVTGAVGSAKFAKLCTPTWAWMLMWRDVRFVTAEMAVVGQKQSKDSEAGINFASSASRGRFTRGIVRNKERSCRRGRWCRRCGVVCRLSAGKHVSLAPRWRDCRDDRAAIAGTSRLAEAASTWHVVTRTPMRLE